MPVNYILKLSGGASNTDTALSIGGDVSTALTTIPSQGLIVEYSVLQSDFPGLEVLSVQQGCSATTVLTSGANYSISMISYGVWGSTLWLGITVNSVLTETVHLTIGAEGSIYEFWWESSDATHTQIHFRYTYHLALPLPVVTKTYNYRRSSVAGTTTVFGSNYRNVEVAISSGGQLGMDAGYLAYLGITIINVHSNLALVNGQTSFSGTGYSVQLSVSAASYIYFYAKNSLGTQVGNSLTHGGVSGYYTITVGDVTLTFYLNAAKYALGVTRINGYGIAYLYFGRLTNLWLNASNSVVFQFYLQNVSAGSITPVLSYSFTQSTLPLNAAGTSCYLGANTNGTVGNQTYQNSGIALPAIPVGGYRAVNLSMEGPASGPIDTYTINWGLN